MKTKTIVLSIIGTILVGGFFCFVLIFAFILTIGDEAKKAEAGKAVVAVRHEFFWSNEEGTVFKKQCIEHTIGICSSPVSVNPSSKKAASDSGCEMRRTAPQPAADRSKTSEIYEYEFELEPDKTYYWFAHVRRDFDCYDIPPPDKLGFQTGEIKLSVRETKRVEADFVK